MIITSGCIFIVSLIPVFILYRSLSNNSQTDEILERVQEAVKRKALTSKATVVGAKRISPWADTEVCPYKNED